MINLENQLIKAVNESDKKSALTKLKVLLERAPELLLSRESTIRTIKDYMILLVAVFYRNAYNSAICRKLLFKKRHDFTRQIENAKSVAEMEILGEEIISFFISVSNEKDFTTGNPIINEALMYIHNHLERDISLKQVADKIHVSCSYLSFLFGKLIGDSFSDYVNKIRIERSKLLLSNTEMSLTEIAMDCGFNSQSYFCYVFKKHVGMTPKAYRKQ